MPYIAFPIALRIPVQQFAVPALGLPLHTLDLREMCAMAGKSPAIMQSPNDGNDPNAASFCSRILFIQDGVIFHELRRKIPNETQEDFYARILQVMAQMGGGSANVL